LAESIWRKNITTQTLAGALREFRAWYGAQARSLFPARALAWLLDRGERKLLIRLFDGKVSVGAGEKGEGLDDASASVASIRTRPTKVILELPREKFLIRRFETPAVARASLAQTLPRDLERKTLLKLDDIFSGHVARPHPDDHDKLLVTQVVLRRDLARAAMEQVGLTLADLDIVRPAPEEDGLPAFPDIVLGQGGRSSRGFRRVLIALAALGLCLFVASGAVHRWRAWSEGEQIDQEIASASQGAALVRKMVGQATAESALLTELRRERITTPPLADLIEETSRILPDTAWLSEWRFSEPKRGEHVLDLSGLAISAADLPALFDKSPLFSDSALTSAITPDIQEKRERFSIQSKVGKKTRVRSQ
jgi:general secretion pathway protein L